MPPRPQIADPGMKRDMEAQRRPTLPSAKVSNRVQDTFTAYDDFPWAKIEEYLKSKWQNWDFKPTQFNGNWQFEVPEKLSDGDRRELRNRRDSSNRTRMPSFSPEPEPQPEPASSS